MSKEKKSRRFVKDFSESTFATNTQIWVDRLTGVNYLFHAESYAGGLTPLLDPEGKPVITPISVLDKKYGKYEPEI